MTSCPHCEESLEDAGGYHFGCDLSETPGGTRDLVYVACCEEMQYEVSAWGYEACYGRTLALTASELGQREILAITDDEQALAVERLRVVDPTQVLEGRCKSPKGWRDEIFADINKHHEHHAAPTSWKFGLAVYNGQAKVAVLVVGRPVSRLLARAEPQTLEVTRGCSLPVHSDLRANAMSKAYAAAAKTARRAGATKLITYTLEEESGHSLRASGWTPTRVGKGGSWSRKKRQRSECSKGATTGRKVRWEKGLTRATRRDVAARALPPRLTPDAQPR